MISQHSYFVPFTQHKPINYRFNRITAVTSLFVIVQKEYDFDKHFSVRIGVTQLYGKVMKQWTREQLDNNSRLYYASVMRFTTAIKRQFLIGFKVDYSKFLSRCHYYHVMKIFSNNLY